MGTPRIRLEYGDYLLIRDILLSRFKHRCYLCSEPVYRLVKDAPSYPDWAKRRATIEHRVPLSRGGEWTEDNLAIACYECNNAKGAMTEDEFRNQKETVNGE